MASGRRKGDEKRKSLERVEPDMGYHTIRFERYFLLTIDITLDGERVLLEGNSKSALHLSPSRSKSQWTIRCDRLLSAASIAGKKHGMEFVRGLFQGRVPMLEVSFAGASQVIAFLNSLETSTYQEQLRLSLSEKRFRAEALTVAVKLYLTIPLGNRDANFVQVTTENHSRCLDMLHQGPKIDYSKVYPGAELSPAGEVLDVEKHLSVIFELTSDVVEWYSLGTFLRVGADFLERIKLECGGYTQEGLVPMLRVWLTSCCAKWSDLFQALCRLGYYSLAQKIVDKTGWVMEDQHSKADWPFEPIVARQHLPMLEEREKQVTNEEKGMQDAKGKLKSLSAHVVELEKLLQEAIDTAKELMQDKEWLVATLHDKEKQHEEVITCRRNVLSEEDPSKLASEIEQAIHDLRVQMERLDGEIHQTNVKKEQLKHELAAKRRQVKEFRQMLKSRSKQMSQLSAMLWAERRIFDLQVQLMKTSPDNLCEEQAAQITFLKEQLKRETMHEMSREIFRAHVHRLGQQRQSTLDGASSHLSLEDEESSSCQYKSMQNPSMIAGLPMYSAVELPPRRAPSSLSLSQPIPKLTSFREATRCLESSSAGASKNLSCHKEEEKKEIPKETFEEYDIIDVAPLSEACLRQSLTPLTNSTQGGRFRASLFNCMSRSSNSSGKNDPHRFGEELSAEYDIIDLTPSTDSHYTPKLTCFKKAMGRSLDSATVVSKCMNNPEDVIKKICEEYDIIDITPPIEIAV